MARTLEIPLSDRFERAADEWGDRRVLDREEAMATKAEQALVEIEHLVSGNDEVEFELGDGTVRYEPSEELSAFLNEQAERVGEGGDPATVLALHVDLFARAFLDDVHAEG